MTAGEVKHVIRALFELMKVSGVYCRFLLTARLHEISDRWTGGPLSTEMTAGEVKHVIRALFELMKGFIHALLSRA